MEKFYTLINRLKHSERQGWKDNNVSIGGVRDTIASHSFGAMMIGFIIGREKRLSDEKIFRLIRMLLIHDLVMANMKDLVPNDLDYIKKKEIENNVFEKMLSLFPESVRVEFKDLFFEFQKEESDVAKLARKADKMDTLFQAREYGLEDFVKYYRKIVDSIN